MLYCHAFVHLTSLYMHCSVFVFYLTLPPKQDKNEAKNLRAKKANSQKPKQKKQHFCHQCGAAGHTRPNCYKWLATQQSNGMIASGNQNQLQSSLTPLGDFLKTFMFLSNLNDFNSSPSPPVQGFNQRFFQSVEGKGLQVILSLFSLFSCFCVCITYVFCFQVLSQSSFYTLVV